MSSKNAVLTRIREALRSPAPLPSVHDHGHGTGTTSAHPGVPTSVDERRAWLPLVPDDHEGRVALFAKNSSELKTELLRVPDASRAAAALAELAKLNGWRRVAAHGAPAVSAALQGLKLEHPPLMTDAGYRAPDMERCDAGISVCDCLVAQTGTIVLTARTAGGRALSVLPPHHVVIASESQLVPDLASAFALLKERHGPDYPSMMTLITGPSRTGDIERILVLGAHGPKRLTVILTAR